MKPACSVIIRAYNEEKHIARLLTGIAQQTVKDVQIILVDSGSKDRTVEIAQQYPVDIVHIRPDEFTFGRSLNRGIEAAHAEVVVFASAHVYPVYPDWLEKMIEPFSNPQMAVVYGKQRGMGTTKFSEHQIFQHWFPDRSQPHQDHPFCNNANAAIRRELWEKHAYDETLPGLEDLAWARWALSQGYQIAYVAEAEIIHIHNETWQNVYNRYKREGMAFKHIYPQEMFHLKDVFRLFMSNVSNDFRAARQQGVLGKEWKSIIHFRWNQFWGTYQGYRQSGELTWKLKQAFYYPRMDEMPVEIPARAVEPIQYEPLEKKS